MRIASSRSRTVRRAVVVLWLPLAGLVALDACSADDLPGVGGGDQATVVPDPAVVADSSLSDPAENASSNATLANDPAFQQVDANTAGPAQLVAVFEANGIADAAARADQVIDHRPYATDDPSGRGFDALRAALAAAGLDEFGVEAVIASLTA